MVPDTLHPYIHSHLPGPMQEELQARQAAEEASDGIGVYRPPSIDPNPNPGEG